jgi:hypothetical protein
MFAHNRIEISEAKTKLYDRHGDNISIIEYTRMSFSATFRCSNCGNVWKTRASSVINGGCGCDACADRKNGDKLFLNISDIRKEIKSYNCELLSDEYYGKSIKLKILFSCGHCGESSLASFRRMGEKICYDCKIDAIKNRKRTPEKDVLLFVRSFGFEFICFIGEYLNQNTKIKYACKKNHITERSFQDFKNSPVCLECKRKERSDSQVGSKSSRWRGGISGLSMVLEKRISEWKNLSMQNCKYRCFVTGDSFDEIHHLYPMNKIISDALHNIKLDRRSEIGLYSDSELFSIIEEVRRIHMTIPLGVCLRKDVHVLFHHIYGSRNTTENDFCDFVSKIESGEIQIPQQ